MKLTRMDYNQRHIENAVGGSKMKGRVWKIVVACLAVVVAVGLAVAFSAGSQDIEAGWADSNTLSLIRPPFVSAAAAGAHFLNQEAGIAAYTNVGHELDLAKAATGFATIEYQTSEYIIGSVRVPGYGTTHDVHAYVHRDGWILAYYLSHEPTAKIFSWGNLGSTKLELGIAKLCDAAGMPFPSATYYDFRYPHAQKMMIIIDYDSFNIKIPGSFSVYTRSYSIRTTGGWQYPTTLWIDGVTVDSTTGTTIGTITPTQLSPDVFHTVSVSGARSPSVALLLTYRE